MKRPCGLCIKRNGFLLFCINDKSESLAFEAVFLFILSPYLGIMVFTLCSYKMLLNTLYLLNAAQILDSHGRLTETHVFMGWEKLSIF